MEQHEHRRKAIEDYILGQFRDTEVEIDHLELMREQWVGTDLYEIWDCTIQGHGRWWAVTPFTNVYHQEGEFRSADFTLTYHIGIRERLSWKDDGPSQIRDGYEPLDAVFREMDQAADLAYQVVEVQDARNAGVALREALVSFVGALRSVRPELADTKAMLKDADFTGWAEVIATQLAGGDRNRKLRKYLKSLVAPTWQYVNWLAHDQGGTKGEAVTALEMCRYFITVYLDALAKYDADPLEECPSCRSRRLSSDSHYLADGYETTRVCEACGWRSETVWTEY